jgi:uncharacterized protein
VDLVFLSDHREYFLVDHAWLDPLGTAGPVAREEWGALSSLRATLASGLELDLGWVTGGWARTDPVDSGTAQVVRDGARILFDRSGRLSALMSAEFTRVNGKGASS